MSKRLVHESDDWSFVVKLHALIETALTQALLTMIARPEREHPIQKLPIRTKIAMVKSLSFLKEGRIAFLESFGALRNAIVHDIGQINTFSVLQIPDQKPVVRPPPEIRQLHSEPFRNLEPAEARRIVLWANALVVFSELHLGRLKDMLKRTDLTQAALHEALADLSPRPDRGHP